MRRRRGIMGLNGGAGIPVITATATGNPLTFETDMVKPLKSLVIPFTPIQAGSGDPSPTNIRPISGWPGGNIYNEETYDASATPKLTINWQTEAGTVYGGTLTLNEDKSADLDSRWVIRNLGQMNDITKTTGSGAWEHRFDCRHYIRGSGYDSGRRNGEPDDIMCSALKWGNAASNGTYLTYSGLITVYDDTVSSVAEFREKYADVQICYVGNDYVRQQYHFDNVGQLVTFLGTNTIWTDTNGTNTATYLKHQS